MALGQLRTNKGWGELMSEVREEFEKWDVGEVLYPTKRDALASGKVEVLVHGKNGEWTEVKCDAFGGARGPEHNLCAIREAVRGARLADQRGIGSVLVAATKLLALPAVVDANSPYAVLGVRPADGSAAVREAYRRRVKETHPDQGGDAAEFIRVQAAGRELGVA